MNSVQNGRFWPIGAGSATLNVSFYWRANEGVGAFTTTTPAPLGAIASLAIVFSDGFLTGVPVSVLCDTIVQYLLNSGVSGWYSPQSGTVESSIRSAVEQFVMPLNTASVYLKVFFDGQFGSVYVG